MFHSNQEQKALEVELDQYSPVLSEEVVTEFTVYSNSVGVPRVGLFEEIINCFLVY